MDYIIRQVAFQYLGDLYFGGNVWQQALEAYAQAIVATEQIRTAEPREAEHLRAFHESWVVFKRAILCAMRASQYPLALTLAERGKIRNFADYLLRREVKPYGVAEGGWQEYQQHLSTAAELERRLSETPSVSEFEVSPQPHRGRDAPIPMHIYYKGVEFSATIYQRLGGSFTSGRL